MALNPDERVFEHSEFKGLRNNVPLERFALSDLAVAVNVDCDDSGRLARRRGTRKVADGVFHSVWRGAGQTLAVRDDPALVRVNPDFTVNVLRTLTSRAPMSYTAVADRAYFSNGLDTGAIDAGRPRTWGLAIPVSQPAAAVVGGSIPGARLQFAVTYLREDGQESGTPTPGVVVSYGVFGVLLSGVPVSSDPTVTHKAVYFSKRDGDTLYRAGIIRNEDTTFLYQDEVSMAVPLLTGHLRPAPAGQFVAVYGGAVALVASGNTLYYSEPYAPERFDLRKNYRFESAITLVATLTDGVLVGTEDAVIWLSGPLAAKWDFQPRLAYGAIPYALTYCSADMVLDGSDDKPAAVFATTQGICVCSSSGSITNLTQERFAYPAQDKGAVIVRRHRGMIQAVVGLQGSERVANVSS
jgi:hypothetical protein